MIERGSLHTKDTRSHDDRATQPRSADEEPRSPMEAVVAAVFAETLGITRVPRTESLFDLGGNSLDAAMVCARLRRDTGTALQVTQFYRTPAVQTLAAWLEAAQPGSRQAQAPAAKPSENSLVRLNAMQAAVVPTPIVTKLAWSLDGQVDEAALRQAANDVHRRHQGLHAHYVESGPALGYAMLPADPGEAQFHRLPDAPTNAAAALAVKEVLDRPFRPADGEMWRCVLVTSTATGHAMFGTAAHHAAFDGRSITVLTEDLETAYAARTAGREPEFGRPVATLADFDTDYREQLAAVDLDAQRRYWRGEFQGVAPCQLSGRTTSPVPPAGPVDPAKFELRPDQMGKWDEYGRAHGIPPFVWVASAFVEALSRMGAARDLGLMVPIAKRGSDLFDASITNRMGVVFLRPNGPARQGTHLLARMADAYWKGMAASDVLLDPEEATNAAASSLESGGVILFGIPYLLYQNNSDPNIRLGSATGKVTAEYKGWDSSPVDLMLVVKADSPTDITLMMVARNDVYPADMSERIGRMIMEVIDEGPERLEQCTAK